MKLFPKSIPLFIFALLGASQHASAEPNAHVGCDPSKEVGKLTALSATILNIVAPKNSLSLAVAPSSITPPPVQPSGGNGFSGTIYLESMNTNGAGTATYGTIHGGANFSNSVSATQVTIPTSVDLEYSGPSRTKIDTIILQTSPYTITHANGVSSSPATLKTRIDLGPNGDSTTALTFVNVDLSKDFTLGKKLDLFVDPQINALGPYYAQLASDGVVRRGIQFYDVSATGGLNVQAGKSNIVLSHFEEFSLAGARAANGPIRLLQDNEKATRLTLRRNLSSWFLQYEVQTYAGQPRTADFEFGIAQQVGNQGN